MKWGLSSPILCSMLLLVTTMSCTVSMPLPVSPPAPPVSTIATVQPVETQISASLDEPIELRRGSIAFFADENLKIRYRVEIEWECPTPEPDQIIACEVPLLW